MTNRSVTTVSDILKAYSRQGGLLEAKREGLVLAPYNSSSRSFSSMKQTKLSRFEASFANTMFVWG